MSIQERIETLSLDKLQACAIALYASGKTSEFEAVLTELERRMMDEFAAWLDANF